MGQTSRQASWSTAGVACCRLIQFVDDGGVCRITAAPLITPAASGWISCSGCMTAAIVILLVIGTLVVVIMPSQDDFAWFLRLRRPGWLTFEAFIPLIWLTIYACFYASALLVWYRTSSWWLMSGYLLLLLLVQSYTWLICRTRRLANGTGVGLAGWLWGVALSVLVVRVSQPAVFLLIPYLLWSPVGTLVTWQMQRLNR